jgi:hypothetical protein
MLCIVRIFLNVCSRCFLCSVCFVWLRLEMGGTRFANHYMPPISFNLCQLLFGFFWILFSRTKHFLPGGNTYCIVKKRRSTVRHQSVENEFNSSGRRIPPGGFYNTRTQAQQHAMNVLQAYPVPDSYHVYNPFS